MMPDLSIIISAYNEEALIASTLADLQTYLSSRPEQFEIIVVDDGSQDKTVASVQAWKNRKGTDLHLLVNQKNMGKGFSIRRGVLESRGRYVIFIDADPPYELYAIDDFLKALRDDCDFAIGLRVLHGSQYRYSLSGMVANSP